VTVWWILHHHIQYIKNCWVRLLSNYNIKYICTIYTCLDTCLMSISRFTCFSWLCICSWFPRTITGEVILTCCCIDHTRKACCIDHTRKACCIDHTRKACCIDHTRKACCIDHTRQHVKITSPVIVRGNHEHIQSQLKHVLQYK
jgi:hypothetical protein